jgi:hypothetical protein
MKSTIKTFFTQKDDVLPIIHDYLSKARIHVCVAVAWFTEESLFDKLLYLQSKGIQIELVITKHKFNDESKNQYAIIEENGGFFTELGSEDQLMHMKFCIIDHSTVISGSANWTKRAFNDNDEEVTIVTNNPDRANEFMNEFDRLKIISGKIESLKKELNISDAIQTLNAIEGLLPLNEPNLINSLTYRLRHIEELEHIVNKIQEGKYDHALIDIVDFKKANSQVFDVTGVKVLQLQTQIKILIYQIEILEFEKVDLEARVESFNFRYTKELNPIISRLLNIRKKIYDKLKKHGIYDEKYKDIEDALAKNELKYKKALEDPVFNISEDESSNLSSLFKELVKLCHPDSPNCIFEDSNEATKVFSLLTDAYRHNDIKKVQEIKDKILSKQKIDTSEDYNKLLFLQAKLEALKRTHLRIIDDLKQIKNSEVYTLISTISDLDEYFATQKELLENKYDQEKNKYVKL